MLLMLTDAGFGRWDAAKAQLGTATVGIAGALTALATNGDSLAEGRFTSWILPFTAGGFLHISLVTGKKPTLSSPRAAYVNGDFESG